MFTAYDKAIAAVLGAVVFFAAEWFGLRINVSAELIQSIAAIVTPFLVLRMPNKSNDA
jgi:hypothetical protein